MTLPAPTHHSCIRLTLLVLSMQLYRSLRIILHQAYTTGAYATPPHWTHATGAYTSFHIKAMLLALMHYPHTGLMLLAPTHLSHIRPMLPAPMHHPTSSLHYRCLHITPAPDSHYWCLCTHYQCLGIKPILPASMHHSHTSTYASFSHGTHATGAYASFLHHTDEPPLYPAPIYAIL